MSQIVHTDQAPAAIGPYSQAVRSGNTVYFSGAIPLVPATGEVVEGDITAQARQVHEARQLEQQRGLDGVLRHRRRLGACAAGQQCQQQ